MPSLVYFVLKEAEHLPFVNVVSMIGLMPEEHMQFAPALNQRRGWQDFARTTQLVDAVLILKKMGLFDEVLVMEDRGDRVFMLDGALFGHVAPTLSLATHIFPGGAGERSMKILQENPRKFMTDGLRDLYDWKHAKASFSDATFNDKVNFAETVLLYGDVAFQLLGAEDWQAFVDKSLDIQCMLACAPVGMWKNSNEVGKRVQMMSKQISGVNWKKFWVMVQKTKDGGLGYVRPPGKPNLEVDEDVECASGMNEHWAQIGLCFAGAHAGQGPARAHAERRQVLAQVLSERDRRDPQLDVAVRVRAGSQQVAAAAQPAAHRHQQTSQPQPGPRSVLQQD